MDRGFRPGTRSRFPFEIPAGPGGAGGEAVRAAFFIAEWKGKSNGLSGEFWEKLEKFRKNGVSGPDFAFEMEIARVKRMAVPSEMASPPSDDSP